MGQPAHDNLVPCDHLLAVDAQVLTRLVRPARHYQRPGNQRPGVARPAGLHRYPRQIHIVAFDHHLLTRRFFQHFRRHVQHVLVHGNLRQSMFEALGRFRLLEHGQQLAHLAQCRDGLLPHAQRHPLRRAEQIAQHRHVVALDVLEQNGRAARFQGAVADFGHFQTGIDFHGNPLELPALFQQSDEIPQVPVFLLFRHVICGAIPPARWL